ncbi:MAG: extracellular solute-binding protein [Candidatus Promineifilaceae bacterium]
MQKSKPVILALLLLGLLLAACGETEPVEVTRIVEVQGETITEMVEVTRIVEGESITEQVEVTRIVEVEVEVPADLELVTIVARCRAKPPTEDWRCNNLLDAVADVNADLHVAGDSRRVDLETIQDNTDFGDIMQEFALSYADGQAADILLTGHEYIGTEATAGRIIPLDDLMGNYPEFDNVIDSLWDSVTFQGQRWGIPQDVESRPVYWDKTLLVQVPGWDEARIEGLADEITAGNFTLSDLLETAEAAVAAGVVEPGMGFWMRPSNGPDFTALYYAYGGETIDADTGNLVFDTEAGLKFYEFFERGLTGDGAHSFLTGDWGGSFHPSVSGSKVVFWAGGSWQWAEWADQWTGDLGGQAYQFENWGYGLYPAAEGGSPVTLSHPLAYLISAQSENPDLALALIAKATTDEANTRHAINSTHLGILKSQADYEPYTQDFLLSDVLYMLDYTTFLPNNPNWGVYSTITYEALAAVQSGDLTAQEAVDLVLEGLQNELGDEIIIR